MRVGKYMPKAQNHENLKVSIIMTVYNSEKYLKQSIDSALNQTLHEIEIVCVDGNSTDSTIDIIREYMQNDPRVKLYTQERPGIGAAKNCGIENALGEYITFLDSDDFYVDRKALKKMYEACQEHGVNICGALRSNLFEDGTVIKFALHRKDCSNHPNGVLLDYADRQYDYHFHSYIFKRNMIIGSGARFNEVKAYDDTHFFIRAMLASRSFYVLPVELYRYRCGPAYDWGSEKANDAILSLTDQLLITKKNELARLHWLTVQRINYEYGGIFEKNIRLGNYVLLHSLVMANEAVDVNLLRQAEQEMIPEEYLETMINRRKEDMPLYISVDNQFVFEPIRKLMLSDNIPYAVLMNEKNALQRELENIQRSRSYKAAKTISKIIKKFVH